MSGQTTQQQLFSFQQLCEERWGGSPSIWTLRRLAESGEVRTVNIGARRFVPLEEVLRIEHFGLGQRRKSTRSLGK